jgi:hypothetical protein
MTSARSCSAETGVRPFEVLSPRGVERVDALVHGLQRNGLLAVHLLARHDDEVDVAVHVRVAHGERALQVRAAEVLLEDRPHSGDEGIEDGVQVGKGGRACRLIAAHA